MKTHIEKKVKQTIESIDGIERANANPFLFGKVMNRMQMQKSEMVYTGKVVLRYAILVVLLVSVNFISIYSFKKQPSPKMKENMAIDDMANEYFVTTKVFEY